MKGGRGAEAGLWRQGCEDRGCGNTVVEAGVWRRQVEAGV